MTSFPEQERRVRDEMRPPQRRLHALRECALHFAPYGFRATWHHLVVSARIPPRLEDDPAALVRAVDELSRARALILPRVRQFEARRRVEKAAGRRAAPKSPWGLLVLTYCPDPERHPDGPLPLVVGRVIARYDAGVDPAAECLVCGTARRGPGRSCATCGVNPDGPAARRPDPSEPERWQRVWRREV